jgi:hypothetical protein
LSHSIQKGDTKKWSRKTINISTDKTVIELQEFLYTDQVIKVKIHSRWLFVLLMFLLATFDLTGKKADDESKVSNKLTPKKSY